MSFWISQASACLSHRVGKTAREIAETAIDYGARFAVT
jgi:hypothetical protein